RPLRPHRRETAVPQHFQVLRDRRLGDAELLADLLGELSCRPFPFGEQFQQTPTYRVTEYVERVHGPDLSPSTSISQGLITSPTGRGVGDNVADQQDTGGSTRRRLTTRVVVARAPPFGRPAGAGAHRSTPAALSPTAGTMPRCPHHSSGCPVRSRYRSSVTHASESSSRKSAFR